MKASSKKFFLDIRCDLLICLFLVISTFAVYKQVSHYDFVSYDDDDYVFENPYIKAGLTSNSIKWAFTSVHADNWHPVTWLSHILDMELYGPNPGQHHLTNLIFHIANSPFDLAFFYPHPGRVLLWQTAASFAALGALSLIVVRKAKSSPYLIVGWLWYLITLIPVIGLVQIGLQSMADRYSYIPLIGLFIILAWGIPDIPLQWQHRKTGLALTAAAFLSMYMTVSWMQIRYWSNSITLFEHALDVTSENHVAHFGLGNVLVAMGETDKAVRHYSEALKWFPNSDIHNNMGFALARKGRTDEAVAHYREALRMDPYHKTTYNNLGTLFLSRGDSDKAIECYLVALKLFPDYAQAHNNLGLALSQKGKNDEAIAHFRRALQIKPDYIQADHNLKRLLTDREKSKP